MKPNAKIEIEVFDNGCIKVGVEGQFTDLTVGFVQVLHRWFN